MTEKKIKITAGNVSATAVLNSSQTAERIFAALPITGSANIWGDEIYFSIPVTLASEADAQEIVQMGELGYWPPGKAFCIFFGPTPASSGSEIRPASPVNVFGKVDGDARVFLAVTDGETVKIEKV